MTAPAGRYDKNVWEHRQRWGEAAQELGAGVNKTGILKSKFAGGSGDTEIVKDTSKGTKVDKRDV